MTTFALRGGSAARRASALACDVRGAGAPLLLIHTLGASGAMFAPALPALAARHQLIVPDLRGHGRSRCLGAPADVGRLADDLVNLLDLLGIRRLAVLGYGYGSVIAQRLAASAPERVDLLALACTPAPSGRLGAATLPGALHALGAAPLAALAARASAADASAARAAMVPGDRAAIAAAGRALIPCDTAPWLPTITAPTLVLAAARDTLAPASHAAALARRLPNATTRTIPGAGHWAIATHTEAFVEALLPFLKD
jgi:3-oxoadipate enol-lactonase